MQEKSLEWENGGYKFCLPENTNRLVDIGSKMNICVGHLDRDKRTVYEQQGGICPICKNHFEFSEMAGDHIVPWSKGGKSVLENLQMLCTDCNLKKSDS